MLAKEMGKNEVYMMIYSNRRCVTQELLFFGNVSLCVVYTHGVTSRHKTNIALVGPPTVVSAFGVDQLAN